MRRNRPGGWWWTQLSCSTAAAVGLTVLLHTMGPYKPAAAVLMLLAASMATLSATALLIDRCTRHLSTTPKGTDQ